MICYAVLDTNVLISGMLKKPSIPNEILTACLVGNIVPVINSDILAEYTAVTARPKFHFPKSSVDILLNHFIKRGVWQNALPVEENLPDPKDRIFYETTIAARQLHPAFLITGNQKHFPPDTDFIVSPHQMLDIILS